jgi:hypothetical protein
MELSRRGFFGTLTAAVAGFALDPERLLWVPGQKTIFLPALTIYRGRNTFITPDWVTRDVCEFWRNRIMLADGLNT